MTETQHDNKQDYQQSSDQQQSRPDSQQGTWGYQPQSSIDQLFSSQMTGGSGTAAEAWNAYFELAEATLRTARRVSEVQVLSLMRAEIVATVKQQVISQITSDPQLRKELFSQ